MGGGVIWFSELKGGTANEEGIIRVLKSPMGDWVKLKKIFHQMIVFVNLFSSGVRLGFSGIHRHIHLHNLSVDG